MAVYQIQAGDNDGYVSCNNATYETARSGAGTKSAVSNTHIRVGQYLTGGVYYCYEGFHEFDTSVIGDAEEIVFAQLVHGVDTDYSDTDFDIEFRLYDWGGGTVGTGDFVAGASLAALPLLGTYNTANQHAGSMAANSYGPCQFTTSKTETALISNINKTGYTRTVEVSSRHRAGTAPGGTERIYMLGQGDLARPYLLVVTAESKPQFMDARARASVRTGNPVYYPIGTTDGTLVIAIIGANNSGEIDYVPAGWTRLAHAEGGTADAGAVFYRYTTDSDRTATTTFTSKGTTQGYCVVLLSFYGVTSGVPIASCLWNSGVDTTQEATALSQVNSPSIVLVGNSASASTSTSGYAIATANPASWTELYDGSGYGTAYLNVAVGAGDRTTLGDTGAGSMTTAGSSDSIGFMVILGQEAALTFMKPELFGVW